MANQVYGKLNIETGELTDMSYSKPAIADGEPCRVVKLDSMPQDNFRFYAYDESTRTAVANEKVHHAWQSELDTRIKHEFSQEYRDSVEISPRILESESRKTIKLPSAGAETLLRLLEGVVPSAALPTKQQLEQILDVSFFSSLTEEERSPTRFSLVFTPRQEEFEHTYGSDFLTFSNRRHLTPAAVAKASPLLDFSQTSLCISPSASHELVIWGVVITGRELHKCKHGDGGGFYCPNLICFSSQKMGHLAVTFNGADLWSYNLGEFTYNWLRVFDEDGPVFRYLNSYKIYYQLPILIPVRQVLRAMRRLGHGGMLIISPSHTNNDFAFSFMFESGNTLLEKAWKRVDQSMDLSNRLYFDGPIAEHRKQERQKAIERCDAIGALGSVDGALVLGTDLRVVGAGARVLDSGRVKVYQAFETSGETIAEFDMSTFGTKHNAAAAYASNNPNGMVFVLSEDGDVSALRSVWGKTIIWRPIELSRSMSAPPLVNS